ncbi:hypothetical protein LZ31DRAFT_600464 [Colletotrichum somersetense]|nr:hypothetical protein LZ31DRAFT_600464 [Colletotrichum somersetense]
MTKRDTKRSGPLVLPNIQFGGFGLDGHPNLQIEMLIHVSCQMIERIEAILGINTMATSRNASAPPPGREHGPLDLRCAPRPAACISSRRGKQRRGEPPAGPFCDS